MDTVLFLGFASAYALLLAWSIILMVRRARILPSDLVVFVLAALVYDNAVLGLGSFIGEGGALEALNGARYWLHAFVTPLLVLVAWDTMVRAGVRWARSTWATIVALAITGTLIVYEIVVGAASARLVAEREYGILSYSNENAPDGPPLMVLLVAAALLIAAVFASLLRVFSGPGVMLSAYERDVPFQIVNRPTRESSRPGLEAERCFEFRCGRQRFVDVLRVGLLPGTLVNTLGRDGRIDVLLKCSVTPDGSLRLRSRAARIRIGPKKFTLPRLFSVKVEAIEGWDAKSERHTISVHVRNPLVGTVLRYRGSFKYEHVR